MRSKSRKLNRSQYINYTLPGQYFVTLVSKNRLNYFGFIEYDHVVYSEYGQIVKNFWNQIPIIHKNVVLGEWIVMPNHIHGVLKIDDPYVGTEHCSVPTTQHSVPTNPRSIPTTRVGYGPISKIIKGFKEACVKSIRKEYGDYEFGWQRSFHDHLIRDDLDLKKINIYIRNNVRRHS